MFASKTIWVIWAALAVVAPSAAQQATQEATQADHKRMLALLGIRRGVEGRNQQSPNFANYDESKVAPYPPLPELMVTKAGTRVTSAKDWWNVRRPELVELFDREVYGRMPKVIPTVSWTVTNTTEETVGGVTMVKKELLGKVDNSSHPAIEVNIEAALWTPKDAKGPLPVILEFGSGGRSQPPRPTSANPPAGPWWQEQVVAKGWGYASIRPGSIQADNGAGLTQGIIGLVNKGQPRKVDDWGALKAWTWGTSRLLDYFETDKAVDATRVALVAGVYAGPVYRLLGKKDLGTTEFPTVETALIDGEIGFRQHTAGHTPGPNWPTFLTFAERYVAPGAKAPAKSPKTNN